MDDIDFDYFEKIIVKNAMLDSAYLSAIVDFIDSKYFNDENIAKYFEIVSDFYDKRKKLPKISEIKTYLTSDSLRKGLKEVIEMFKDIDDGDKNELYENTERFLKERGMYHAILESAESIGEGIYDTSGIVDRFEKIAGINLNTDKGFELYSGSEQLINDILNEDSMISSKWDWLNEAIGGGFRENGKALYMLAGQSNIGKSIFLGNIAANIAEQGKSVLVVSLEMPELLYAQRIASNITKIPMSEFKHDVHSLREGLDEKKKKNPEGRIYIKEFPPSTITPKQLSSFIKRMIDDGVEIDAIVIDYVSLLHSPQGSNSYERIKYICEQVRAMSYIFECPTISACQLNRGNFGVENPGMEGIAESMGVAVTSDLILSIFQNEEDKELGIIRLGMMKNRFGMVGMVKPMKIDYSTLTVYESEDEEELMEDSECDLLDRLSNESN